MYIFLGLLIQYGRSITILQFFPILRTEFIELNLGSIKKWGWRVNIGHGIKANGTEDGGDREGIGVVSDGIAKTLELGEENGGN